MVAGYDCFLPSACVSVLTVRFFTHDNSTREWVVRTSAVAFYAFSAYMTIYSASVFGTSIIGNRRLGGTLLYGGGLRV